MISFNVLDSLKFSSLGSALTRSPLDTTFLTKFNFFNVSDDLNVVSISQYIPTVIDVDEQMVISQQNDDAVEELLQNVDEDFCRTSECVLSASRMDSLIDYKVRPCDDFYNFACGRFVRDSTLHDRRDSLNAFSITDDKLKEQLRRLFTRKVENHEIKPFRLAKMLYKSCINSCAAEVRGIEPLKNIIQAIGGWPMLGDWNESGWNLEQSIMKLRLQFSNNAKNIFRAAKPFTIPLGAGDDDARASLGGSKSDKRKSQKFLQAYRSYLIDIAVIVGADRRTVESQIDDAIEFQIELTKLSLRRESSGAFGVIANRVSLNYSLMQWLDLFQSVPDQFLVDGNQKSALSGNDFFNAFEKLWSKTSKQTLANFFILRIVGFSSQYMTKEMKQRALHYRMELFGVKQKEESWKQCVDVVSKTLKLAAEAMFSKEYFDLRSKETAIDIAERVKRAYVEILSTIPWMKSAEKAKAILTVDKIIAKLRFPKERLSDQQIDFFYRQLSIEKPENYLETVFRLTTFIADRKFLLLQIGINLDAEESVGVLSSVDVKDYNPICKTSKITFHLNITSSINNRFKLLIHIRYQKTFIIKKLISTSVGTRSM